MSSPVRLEIHEARKEGRMSARQEWFGTWTQLLDRDGKKVVVFKPEDQSGLQDKRADFAMLTEAAGNVFEGPHRLVRVEYLNQLHSDLELFRQALQFYAKGDHTYSHPENAVSDYRWDSGKRARDALAGKKPA